MKHLGRPFLATILALSLFCLTGFALATGASAHTTVRSQVSNEQHTLRPNSTGWLGPLWLDWYCKSYAGMKGAELDGSSNPTVYDWGCVDANGRWWALSNDMDAACRWQYSDSSAEEYVGDFHNPYSTYCFDAYYAGGLDLDWYCKSQGYIGVTLDWPDTVYDWNCVEQNGTQVHIDMNTACQFQYSPSHAVVYISRFTLFYNASSVQCWGFGAQGPTP